MRLYDAYRYGLITQAQYAQRLSEGYTPNSLYTSPGSIEVSVPNYATGTTTNTMTEVLSSIVSGSIKQSVTVHNSGSTNSLNVSIEYYAANILVKTVSETIIALGVLFWETESVVSSIIIKVQSTVSGSHTTYEAGIVSS